MAEENDKNYPLIGLIKRDDKICSFMSFKIEFEESRTFSFVLQYFIAFHIVFNLDYIVQHQYVVHFFHHFFN
jgi:hypothetical protein